MGKEKGLEGKKVKSETELRNGWTRIVFDDGTAIICQIVPLEMKVTKEEDKGTKEKGKGAKDDDLEWDDIKDLDEDELVDLIKEHKLKIDPEDFEDKKGNINEDE
jgi:hypothetical protein